MFLVTAGLIASLILAGCAAPAAESEHGSHQSLTLRMGEGEIIREVDGVDKLDGEFHRWEPAVLVVHKGDEVTLTIENPRSKYHSFALPEFGVVTPKLEPRGGTATVEFTADKAGVFQYACGVPFSREGDATDCNEDHKRQVGYLIVLEK